METHIKQTAETQVEVNHIIAVPVMNFLTNWPISYTDNIDRDLALKLLDEAMDRNKMRDRAVAIKIHFG